MSIPLKDGVNLYLEAIFLETSLPNRRVYDAARYTLLLPGKRLRPLITLYILETFGLNPLKYIQPASSVELIHTYSLIHDDLPCMDDDAFRRGRPALHIAYDEATALLAGDLLLTHAFQLISTAEILTEKQKIRLITSLANAAGGEGMIGGQMLDLLGNNKVAASSYLTELHSRKTGALIGYAFEAAGIIAEQENHERLRKIGVNIGLAFQIIDDILDTTQTSEQLGKPAGSDQKNEKLTILSVCSFDEATKWAEALLDEAQENMRALLGKQEKLELLIDSLVHRVT